MLRRRAGGRQFSSPLSISGLVGWWTAESFVGSDGDLVSTWADSSGNSKDATATLSLRPTYKTGILNGKPVMRFGAANGMVTPSIDLTGTDKASMFAVFSAPSGGDRVVMERSTNLNTAGGILVYRTAGNIVQATYKLGAGYETFDTTTTVTTTHKVLVATFDQSQLTTARAKAWVNGDGAGTGSASGGGATAGNFGNHATYIGARGQVSLFLGGDIAECGWYSRALSTADRDALETYLGAKYGISVA